MNKKPVIFIYIILGAFISFGFVEYVSFTFNKHASFSYRVWKQVQYADTLKQARNYYGETTQELELDEVLLAQKAWPKAKYFSEHTPDEKDPFARLLNWNDNAMEDLEIRRAINSVEDIQNMIANKGTTLRNRFYVFSDEQKPFIQDPVDDIIVKALYCDVLGYDDFDYTILGFTNDEQGGYLDTHYLLNLLILKKHGCHDSQMIQEEIDMVIARLVSVQESDIRFSDLYAERIVLLYWAGAGDQVQEEWIQKINDNVMDDGGWSDIHQGSSNSHTTGLSALALRYFLDGEREQKFYRE